MSIDISKVSSLLNQISNPSVTTKTNNYSIDFAEVLMDSLSSQKNTTTVNDLSNAFQMNLNDTASLKGTIEQTLKSNSTTGLFGGVNSTSSPTWNDLFTSQSSQTSALQTLYSPSSSSTPNDTISDALQSNFLSKQMNLMQTAYNKLQANLDDYKNRNAGFETEAFKNRIAEITKNVSTVQTYMQEKLAEKSTNESLKNQINTNGQLASINFKL